MTDNRTYHWKNLNLDKKYLLESLNKTSQINTNDIDFSFIKKYFKDSTFLDDFTNYHDAILISKRIKKLIDDLLESYNLVSFQNEFYVLSAIIQKEYIYYYENPLDLDEPLMKDFQSASKDIKALFEILRQKLDNGNSLIKSASFNLGENKTIKSFFIVDEILEILIDSYGLTLDNFDLVLSDNIERYVNVNMKELAEYHKWRFIHGFYNFIKSKDYNGTVESHDLKFIVMLFHISQIPINVMQFEISDSNSIEDYFDEQSIKYMRLTLNRPKKLNLKI